MTKDNAVSEILDDHQEFIDRLRSKDFESRLKKSDIQNRQALVNELEASIEDICSYLLKYNNVLSRKKRSDRLYLLALKAFDLDVSAKVSQSFVDMFNVGLAQPEYELSCMHLAERLSLSSAKKLASLLRGTALETYNRLLKRPYSADTKRILAANAETMQEAARRLAPLIEEFSQRLARAAGSSFSSDESGYRASFDVVQSNHQTAFGIHRTLTCDGRPAFVRRRLPPHNRKGHVVFEVRNLADEKKIGKSSDRFPELLIGDSTDAIGSFRDEMAKQQQIEDLRRRLGDWEGSTLDSLEQRVQLAQELNQARDDCGVSFAFRETAKSKLETVYLQARFARFILLHSADKSTVHSSVEFPQVFLIQ